MFKKILDMIGIKRQRNNIVIMMLLLVLLMPYLIYNLNIRTLQQQAARVPGSRKALAAELQHKVRVLCLVITTPQNHGNRAVHVKRTWGQYCNRLLFISTEEHGELESVALPVKDEREHNWGKIKAAFKYVRSYHLHEADWFMMTHDDTFVILENLRYLLQHYNPQNAIYFGCKMRNNKDQNYKIDGPGYVLSKAALNRFITRALPNSTICSQNSLGSVDFELGRCLRNVDVIRGDTRDAQGAETFIANWFPKKLDASAQNTSIKLPKHAISLHKVDSNEMYTLEFLIHRLRLFGMQ